MTLRLRPAGVTDFAARARPWLLAMGEAQHSLPLGVLSQIEAGGREAPRLLLVERASGETAGVVMHTPPSPWIVAGETTLDPADLAAALAALDGPPVRDLVGESRLTTAVAAELARRRGIGEVVRIMRMPIMACERLVPPTAPPAGRVRPATTADLDLVDRLQLGFQRDALPQAVVDPRQLRVRLAHRLSGAHGIRLFERPDGEVVAMAEWGSPTPNGARVYAVYTPAEHRGHGYGAATVAAVTAEVLATRRFAFLNTDGDNPTSNALYHRLGYVSVGEQSHWRIGAS